MEKTLQHQLNISSSLIFPMEKVRLHEGFFFEVVMVMLKDKQKYTIKDTMSIKISFMHYMKWIRVMLPVAFEEFELVFSFLLFFLVTITVNW